MNSLYWSQIHVPEFYVVNWSMNSIPKINQNSLLWIYLVKWIMKNQELFIIMNSWFWFKYWNLEHEFFLWIHFTYVFIFKFSSCEMKHMDSENNKLFYIYAVQFTQVGSCQSVLLQTYAFYISIKISTAAVTCGFCHFLARQMSQKNIWILAGVRRCATRQLAASVLLPQVESPSYTFQHSMQQKNISIVFAVPGQRERIQNIVYYMS